MGEDWAQPDRLIAFSKSLTPLSRISRTDAPRRSVDNSEGRYRRLSTRRSLRSCANPGVLPVMDSPRAAVGGGVVRGLEGLGGLGECGRLAVLGGMIVQPIATASDGFSAASANFFRGVSGVVSLALVVGADGVVAFVSFGKPCFPGPLGHHCHRKGRRRARTFRNSLPRRAWNRAQAKHAIKSFTAVRR